MYAYFQLEASYCGSNTDYKSSEPLKALVMLCYVIYIKFTVIFTGLCIKLPSSHLYNTGITWKVRVCCTHFFVY